MPISIITEIGKKQIEGNLKENKIPIPKDIALHICEEIRETNSKKKLSLAKGQCCGYRRYSNKKGDIKHRCIFSNNYNRGCQLVNMFYDKSYKD